MAKAFDFGAMSLAELDEVIDGATAARTEKVNARRAELLAELEKIGGAPKTRKKPDGEPRKRAPMSYTYKHPESGETWSGRGATPQARRGIIRVGMTSDEKMAVLAQYKVPV